jgi:hypothetical protein
MPRAGNNDKPSKRRKPRFNTIIFGSTALQALNSYQPRSYMNGVKTMATINQLYPSRFLKAEDMNGEDVSYTIQGLELEEVGSDQEDKPVLYFKESDKGLILNKTNFKTIASICGQDSDD